MTSDEHRRRWTEAGNGAWLLRPSESRRVIDRVTRSPRRLRIPMRSPRRPGLVVVVAALTAITLAPATAFGQVRAAGGVAIHDDPDCGGQGNAARSRHPSAWRSRVWRTHHDLAACRSALVGAPVVPRPLDKCPDDHRATVGDDGTRIHWHDLSRVGGHDRDGRPRPAPRQWRLGRRCPSRPDRDRRWCRAGRGRSEPPRRGRRLGAAPRRIDRPIARVAGSRQRCGFELLSLRCRGPSGQS